MGVAQPVFSSLPNPENHTLSNDQIGNEITLLAGHINAATYRMLTLIAEFDNREGWNGHGVKSCAHWLSWKCGISVGAAREKVRVAHRLAELPKINAAFETGALSFSKVRAMTRIATLDNEDYLLMIAKHGTASHLSQLISKSKIVESNIKQSQPCLKQSTQEEQRSLMGYQEDDGSWHIHAKLPAEVGALVMKAIETILNQEQEQKKEQALEQREQSQPLSGNNDSDTTDTKNVSAETFTEDESEQEKRSFSKRRANALAMMAEHFLATASNDEGLSHLKGSERTQLMLHVDINTLRKHIPANIHDKSSDICSHDTHDHAHTKPNSLNHCCNIDNKHWLTPETAKRLSCDASLVTVLEDDKGNVLNIGRRSRVIPPHIQRALSIRDTGCSFPGCCNTHYLDAHHIKHWAEGGETSLDNLLMLCRHHHRQLHQGKFTIEKADSDIKFLTAKGKLIRQTLFPQFPNQDKKASITYLKKLSPEIESDTAVTKWQGERMDYDAAIGGLKRNKLE